jgi:hypothetical protein
VASANQSITGKITSLFQTVFDDMALSLRDIGAQSCYRYEVPFPFGNEPSNADPAPDSDVSDTDKPPSVGSLLLRKEKRIAPLNKPLKDEESEAYVRRNERSLLRFLLDYYLIHHLYWEPEEEGRLSFVNNRRTREIVYEELGLDAYGSDRRYIYDELFE